MPPTGNRAISRLRKYSFALPRQCIYLGNRTFSRESRRQARNTRTADAIAARVLAATTAAAVTACVGRRRKQHSLPHDKNDPLFCGFAEVNFFTTWGNAHFSRGFARKSTEKYPVFIIGASPLSSQPFVPALRLAPPLRRFPPPLSHCGCNKLTKTLLKHCNKLTKRASKPCSKLTRSCCRVNRLVIRRGLSRCCFRLRSAPQFSTLLILRCRCLLQKESHIVRQRQSSVGFPYVVIAQLYANRWSVAIGIFRDCVG